MNKKTTPIYLILTSSSSIIIPYQSHSSLVYYTFFIIFNTSNKNYSVFVLNTPFLYHQFYIFVHSLLISFKNMLTYRSIIELVGIFLRCLGNFCNQEAFCSKYQHWSKYPICKELGCCLEASKLRWMDRYKYKVVH